MLFRSVGSRSGLVPRNSGEPGKATLIATRNARVGYTRDMDEHEDFERMVGGPDRAFRLLRLYTASKEAASSREFTIRRMPTLMQIFRHTARDEGYTMDQIVAFLALQH